MKLLVISIFFSLLCLGSAAAYEIQVESSSPTEIILSVSHLDTVDLKITDLQETVETQSLSDTYKPEYALHVEGDKVFLTVGVAPIYEDYAGKEIDAILISGNIEVEGEKTAFAKRVAVRPTGAAIPSLAPAQQDSSLVYWTTTLAILLTLVILVLLFRKPRRQQRLIKKAPVPKKKGKKKKVSRKKKR